jgi:geranylgeranyl pyrophosphate synthase
MECLAKIEDSLISKWRGAIDSELLSIFSAAAVGAGEEGDCNLIKACRYVSGGGGKRLRGLLVLGVAYDLLGGVVLPKGAPNRILDEGWLGFLSAASAVELLHEASLVHDDLPAIDNDDMRRGLPACHRAFGEASAILAGDGLVGRAFMVITGARGLSSDNQARIVRLLGRAWWDLCCGQQMDLELRNNPSHGLSERVMQLKTGALFGAAFGSGAICGGVSEAKLAKYVDAGIDVGVVFQYLDDLADGDGDSSKRELVRGRSRDIVDFVLPSLDVRLGGGATRRVLDLVFSGT